MLFGKVVCKGKGKGSLENVKSTNNNNNKFKISAPTWNETFDLLD